MKCCSSRRHGAALAVAACLAAASGPPSPALAQTPPAAAPSLDPDSPLADLPDLGVDWPTITDEPAVPAQPGSGILADAGADLRYEVEFAGLDTDQADQVTAQFDQLSTLKAGEKQPSNVAQVDRRAREDADLLAELLRSRGYYDAVVDPRVATR